MLQPITSCAFDTFDMYKEVIDESGRDPSTRKMQGGENDVNDLRGCQIEYELGQWRKSSAKHEAFKNTWERSSASIDGTMISEGNFYLGYKYDIGSHEVLKDKSLHPAYIGPWQKTTLTRTEGSFFNRKKITEERQIRFFAYQKKEGGRIFYQYESMNEGNKNIPTRPFSLSPTGKIAPSKFNLCAVKWVAKFGYNAIYDKKTKKIIQVGE